MTAAPPTGKADRVSTLPALPSRSARRSLKRELFLVAAGFVLVSGVLVAVTLAFLRAQAIEAGERLTESFAQVIEEQTSRTLQAIDQRLELAADRVGHLRASGRLTEASARDLLRREITEIPFIRSLWVMDTQGRITLSSDAENVGLDLSDRDYFQVHRNHPSDDLYLGVPVRGRTTGIWGIGVSRALRSPDGGFAGVIAAGFEPRYVDRIWGTVKLGAHGAVVLLRADGVMLMRNPFDETKVGRSFAGGEVFAALGSGPIGTLKNITQDDGISRVLAYRRLPVTPGPVVIVGQSYDVILASWRQFANVAIAVWGAASLAIIILCVFLNRAWQRGNRSDARIQQMAERLALATDSAAIGIWDWSPQTGEWYASPTYFTMMGLDPDLDQTPGQEWVERFHAEDQSRVLTAVDDILLRNQDQYRYEGRLRHRDGSYRWVSGIGRLIDRDRDGKAIRVVGVRIDITELKQAQEELRKARDLLRSVLEHVPAGIFWKDRESRYLGGNAQFARHAGFESPEELSGRTDLEMAWKDHADLYRANDRTVMESGVAMLDFEHPGTGPDGSTLLLSTSKVPLRDEGGEVIGLLGIQRDITDRKAADEAIRASLREKEALLKEVHHRVKNNLQVITSLLRLEAGRSAADTRTVLSAMQARIQSMALLHETLYRSGTFASIDLGAYLRQLAAQAFRTQSAQSGAVHLELDLASAPVEMDQAIPCGLLVNELISNSLKHGFRDGGGGEIRVELTRSGEDGFIRLRVSDTGAGLPHDFATRRGASLGLQLVSDLARQLRGTLEIGPGAVFTLTFQPTLKAAAVGRPTDPQGPPPPPAREDS